VNNDPSRSIPFGLAAVRIDFDIIEFERIDFG